MIFRNYFIAEWKDVPKGIKTICAAIILIGLGFFIYGLRLAILIIETDMIRNNSYWIPWATAPVAAMIALFYSIDLAKGLFEGYKSAATRIVMLGLLLSTASFYSFISSLQFSALSQLVIGVAFIGYLRGDTAGTRYIEKVSKEMGTSSQHS